MPEWISAVILCCFLVIERESERMMKEKERENGRERCLQNVAKATENWN